MEFNYSDETQTIMEDEIESEGKILKPYMDFKNDLLQLLQAIEEGRELWYLQLLCEQFVNTNYSGMVEIDLYGFEVKKDVNYNLLYNLKGVLSDDVICQFNTISNPLLNYYLLNEDGNNFDVMRNLEYTLDVLIDNNISDSSIKGIMGAYIPTRKQFEKIKKEKYYTPIGHGYIIEGFVIYCNAIFEPKETQKQKNIIKEKLKSLFEKDRDFFEKTCKKIDDITNFLEYNFYQNMEEFDRTMSFFTPIELAIEIEKNPDFSINDEYFTFNTEKYEGLKSFSNLYEFYIQFVDELCDEIIENFDELQEILDDYITDIILQK